MTEYSERLKHIYSSYGYPIGAINNDITSKRGRPLHMRGGYTLEEAAILKEAFNMWKGRIDGS